MAVEVRRILPSDGHLLARIRLAALKDSPFAFGSTYDGEAGRSGEDWSGRARYGAEASDRATFFAFVDGEAVGLVGLHRAESQGDTVEVLSMWVAPSARRSGAGQALLGAVLRWAKAAGARSVGLWVTCGNDPAMALYQREGFRATGDYQPLPSDPCRQEQRMALPLDTTHLTGI